MQTLGLSHYNLRAPRELMERLRAFYCEVVGLRVGPRPPFTSFGYWLYAGDNAVLHLSEARPGETRGAEGATTFDHVAFDCEGQADFERRLSALGISYQRAQVPQTGQAQLFFHDPAHNGVELTFAPSHPKAAP
ncbi:MAG: VOC family protein [Rhizobacter sp.]|nr:VOC family protein [Rhizobacter sp.]